MSATSVKKRKLPDERAAAGDLMLAGEPLAQPRAHQVQWKVGIQFKAEDDPDRMVLPWAGPAFLAQKDPRSQLHRTHVEPVQLPAGVSDHISLPIKPFAKFVHGVLEPEECAALLSCVNEKGFSPALVNVGCGVQQYDPRYRSSGRCIVDSPQLAEYLGVVLRPHLPDSFFPGTRAEVRVEEVNERCRFLCYKPGDMFSAHCDGCYYRPQTHAKAGSKSMVTVQLYLHDLPPGYGGATTFIGRETKVRCQPRVGSVLIFSQDLLHEGSRLEKGLKHVLRTEVMYSPAAASSQARAKEAVSLETKALSLSEKQARRDELKAMRMEDASNC